MSTINGRLRCDMRRECEADCTHIGAKGYVYCANHAPDRIGVESTRKMTRAEIRILEAGGVIPYRRQPKGTEC